MNRLGSGYIKDRVGLDLSYASGPPIRLAQSNGPGLLQTKRLHGHTPDGISPSINNLILAVVYKGVIICTMSGKYI